MVVSVEDTGSQLQDSGPELRLSEIISAMSYALDVTGGQPENHAVRSCIIGLRIAAELGLKSDDQDALFYALLLKDLGCSSNAARMCALFQADDREVKNQIRLVDWTSQLTTARFSLGHAKPGARFDQRLRAVLGIAARKEEASRGLIQVRCERGADISRDLGFPERTAETIATLYELWNGSGQPRGLEGDAIPLLARIASLAQNMEVFIANAGFDTACAVAQKRSGKWFDPEIVNVFLRLATSISFQLDVTGHDPRAMLRSLEPEDNVRMVDSKTYDQVALAFSNVIDAKSPWTLQHSQGVANIARGIAGELGFHVDHQREIYRAGLLHDIGKLGVSNLVLDKQGSLSDAEFDEMRAHAMHTQKILGRVSAFDRFADYASAHHERLDGNGYHRGLAGDEVAPEARILAVADVCEALTADRPYRQAMPPEQALDIINAGAGTAFCPQVVAAFMDFQEKTALFDSLQERMLLAA